MHQGNDETEEEEEGEECSEDFEPDSSDFSNRSFSNTSYQYPPNYKNMN